MPITWRNIDIGSNQSANQLINAGGNTITEGISQLGDIVTGINKVGAANVDARTKVNTEDAVATLAGITDSKALAAAMASGGALNKDTLRGKYGAELDMNKASALLETKKSELSRLDTEAKIREEDLAQKNQDRIDEADRFRQTNKNAQDQLSIARQRMIMDLAEKQKSLLETKQQQQLAAKFLEIQITNKDADSANAKSAALIADATKQGIATNVILGAKTQGTGLFDSVGNSTKVLALHQNTITAFDKAKQEVDSAFSDVERRYKKENNYDPAMLTALQQPGQLDGAIAEDLVKRYMPEGGTALEDTAPAAAQLIEIRNLLQNAVGDSIQVTPAVMEDLIKQSGHDESSFWFYKTNAKFEANPQIINKLAARIKSGAEWLPGGVKDNQLQLITKAKIKADEDQLFDRTQAINHIALAGRNEKTKALLTGDVAYAGTDMPTLSSDFTPATAKVKGKQVVKELEDKLRFKHDSLGNPIQGVNGEPELFMSEADKQAAARKAKALADAQKGTIKKIDEALGNSPLIKANPLSVLLKGGYE